MTHLPMTTQRFPNASGGDRRRNGEAGLSLLEATMTTALLGVVAVIMGQALSGLDNSRQHQRESARITEVIDEIARTVQQEAATAEIVFVNDALGRGYLSTLDLPERTIPNTSRLPNLTNQGFFTPDDPLSPETGNLLLLGCAGSVLGVEIDSSSGGGGGEVGGELGGEGGGEGGEDPRAAPGGETASPGDVRLIGTFVFTLWFVTPNDNGGLGLARWASVSVASQPDIEAISDLQERADVVEELYRTGIRFSWDPDLPVGNGLYQVNDGWVSAALASAKIPGNFDTTNLRLLQARHIQVARNGAMGNIPVPKYGLPDPGGNFPAGFEIKVDGPGKGKLLMLRLALQTTEYDHEGVVVAPEDGHQGPHGVTERVLHCPRAR